MEPSLIFIYQLRDSFLIVITGLAAYLAALFIIRNSTRALGADTRAHGIQILLLRFVEIILSLWAALLLLDTFHIDVVPLFATAGVVGIIATFASHSLLKDIMGGISILLHDRFRKGDIITIDGIHGVVEDITLTHTIVSEKHTRYSIPNGFIGVVGIVATNDQRTK